MELTKVMTMLQEILSVLTPRNKLKKYKNTGKNLKQIPFLRCRSGAKSMKKLLDATEITVVYLVKQNPELTSTDHKFCQAE